MCSKSTTITSINYINPAFRDIKVFWCTNISIAAFIIIIVIIKIKQNMHGTKQDKIEIRKWETLVPYCL